MAATITKRTTAPNLSVGVADVKMDNSYPTGGYLLAPSDFRFATAIEVIIAQSVKGYDFEFDPATSRLKAYRVNTTGAVQGEVPAATDLSAVTLRVVALGI